MALLADKLYKTEQMTELLTSNPSKQIIVSVFDMLRALLNDPLQLMSEKLSTTATTTQYHSPPLFCLYTSAKTIYQRETRDKILIHIQL
jgi:hypothetical protein